MNRESPTNGSSMDSPYRITTERELESVIGAPMEFVKAKVLPRLAR